VCLKVIIIFEQDAESKRLEHDLIETFDFELIDAFHQNANHVSDFVNYDLVLNLDSYNCLGLVSCFLRFSSLLAFEDSVKRDADSADINFLG
jgi:hypothetical protein